MLSLPMRTMSAWSVLPVMLIGAFGGVLGGLLGGLLGGAGRVPIGVVGNAFAREFPGGFSWVFEGGFWSAGVAKFGGERMLLGPGEGLLGALGLAPGSLIE